MMEGYVECPTCKGTRTISVPCSCGKHTVEEICPLCGGFEEITKGEYDMIAENELRERLEERGF